MQIYGKFDPKSVSDHLHVQSQLESCLAEVRAWMLKNMLKINDEKTEFILFINPQQARFVTEVSITLGGAAIKAIKTVRNLGVMMNTHLDASDQVSAIVRSCNYHLCRIAQVRRYISEEACKLAVLALIISRLDYCNGLLAGATEQMYDKLQRIQNRAARLVVRQRVAHSQTLHPMLVLQRLHWLPVRQRVIYKLCLQAFKCLHGTAPSYLMELLHLHTRDRWLRPASLLQFNIGVGTGGARGALAPPLSRQGGQKEVSTPPPTFGLAHISRSRQDPSSFTHTIPQY